MGEAGGAVFRGGTGEGAVCGICGGGQILELELVAQRQQHNDTGSDGCGCRWWDRPSRLEGPAYITRGFV